MKRVNRKSRNRNISQEGDIPGSISDAGESGAEGSEAMDGGVEG